MKKLAILFLFALSATSHVHGQAQENGIKLNPLALIIGAVNVQYERAITEKTSAQLGLFFINFSIGDTKLSGFGLTPEYRFYVAKEALDGFYAAPLINFNTLNLEVDTGADSGEASLTTFGAGAKIGWNWLLGEADNFIIDLGLGANYSGTNLNVSSGDEGDFEFGAFDGLRPVINFSIGYAF